MAGGVVFESNKRCRAPEERVGAGGDHDTFRLSLLASGAAKEGTVRTVANKYLNERSREASVTELLGLREGLARQGCLVDGQVDRFREATIRRHDVPNLE